MATPADPIAIARDIAHESCLRIPITEPEQIARRRRIFVAASAVKEMCNYANGKEGVANLILYGALIVEYAADFLAKNPHREMSEHKRCVLTSITILPSSRQSLTLLLSVLDEMEHIKDVLKSIQPGDDLETESRKNGLIKALADVRLSHPTEICILTSLTLPQRIYEWTNRRLVGLSSRPLNDIVVARKVNHKRPLKEWKADCWDIEAQNFIKRNPNWDRGETKNFAQFLSESPVSFLALRNEDAVKFLDILEKVCAPKTYRPVPMQHVLNTFIDVGCAH